MTFRSRSDKSTATMNLSLIHILYGPPMDYTVRFESVTIENSEPDDPAETVYSESMEPGD